jgi:hypothetical protein
MLCYLCNRKKGPLPRNFPKCKCVTKYAVHVALPGVVLSLHVFAASLLTVQLTCRLRVQVNLTVTKCCSELERMHVCVVQTRIEMV